MTTKEFEYIKENWDKCIRFSNNAINGRWTYGLEPYRLRLFETLKPEGDCFLCFPSEEYDLVLDKGDFMRRLADSDFSCITIVRMPYKYVQRITGFSKGGYKGNWKEKDWKVVVRNWRLKQILNG
jgi:hypothetical protein